MQSKFQANHHMELSIQEVSLAASSMKLNLTILLLVLLSACSSSKKNSESSAPETPVANESSAQSPVAKHSSEIIVSEEVSAIWEEVDPMTLPDLEKRITPKTYTTYRCLLDQLTQQLDAGITTIELPTTSGMTEFSVQNSNTMSPALAAKFPNIRSFKGKSSNGNLQLRLDTNDEGLFAEISGVNRKELIAPLLKGSQSYYVLYKEADLDGGTPRDETYD